MLREWNKQRKKSKLKLAMKSCVKFTLAGKRYKAGVLSAARHAKELERKGIEWGNRSADEVAKMEKETNNSNADDTCA